MSRLRTVLILIALADWVAAEDVLIAHQSVPVEAVDQATLRDVFLGRRTTWPNGERVVVIFQRDTAANDRLAGRLGKTPQQLVNWWKRLVFTGEGSMPEQIDMREDMFAHVSRIPGAIGWVERPEVVPTGLKVLAAP